MNKKQALLKSAIALLLCFSMLVGSTFAWFTDSVKTGINTIAAGTLDVELYHTNAAVANERVNSATKLFMDLQGQPILWEPGVVSFENLRVVNEGDLALTYKLTINTANENFVVDPESGELFGLSQALKVGFVPGGITATDRASVVEAVDITNWTTLADFQQSGSLLPVDGQTEESWGIVIYWQPGDHDNSWNLNNGKQLNEGDVLSIDLGVKLVATQEVYESDSFGSDYDADAKGFLFPDYVGGSASVTVVPNDQNETSAAVIMTAGQVAASVPAGVKLATGVNQLKLTVTEMNDSGANVKLGEDENMRSLDVHIEGVDPDNQVPITVVLKEVAPKGLNMGNYKLYHVENGVTNQMTLVDSADDFSAHNQFKYDPVTGDIQLHMSTFSEVTVVANQVNAWKGEFDYSWYTNAAARSVTTDYVIANADQLAAFGAIVGGMDGQIQNSFSGKTVKLIADINLGDAEEENNPDIIFYPIGYYNNTGSYEKKSGKVGLDGAAVSSNVSSFSGTFDGNGHTIADFYQNTWEMFGDYNDGYSGTPNHYKDAMGLFGYVYGGTVKNLTVDNFSSDGEFTPTGVIAAYAVDSTFENIAITNCNPRVYNTGNGGIIGIAGRENEKKEAITLKNITVDNSNKISALWGSWDVACGGLVGMYRGNVDGSGNATGDTISFENCHVSAQIDVYNDVCANYQYYAYRYSGMIIGSIRHNTTTVIDGVTKTIPNMAGISATGCTVNYGDWNDYYYCEFEKNTMASYSEDYQFSRVPHSELDFKDSNGNGVVDADERASVIGCKHDHTAEENHQAIYLPFHQLFTGYSWGVSSIGLEKYSGIATNLDITEGDQQESVEKFEVRMNNIDAENGTTTINGEPIVNGADIKVGDLFQAKAGAESLIKHETVKVFVSPIGDNSTVAIEYTGDTTNWTQGTVKFSGSGSAEVIITDYNFCKETKLTISIGTSEKFKAVFDSNPNEAGVQTPFLYRVGNANNVKLSSLFAALPQTNINSANVEATIDALENSAASGEFKANETNWLNGEIDFNGTGPVKVTLAGDSGTPVELTLEVIDAYNATEALSAPYKYNGVNYNVVLLNNVEYGSFTVTAPYGFYGNGFTITLNPNSHSLRKGNGYAGYIHMNGGTLDNVRIEGPVFAESNIYQDQALHNGNGADDPADYFRNAINIDSGNAKITNSYISGARTAICVKAGGNVVIENSRISGGAYANIEVLSASSLTLKNVVTEQKAQKDSYGNNKDVIGIGIVINDAETKLILDGLTQYNWMTQVQWENMLGSYKNQFPKLFTENQYKNLWYTNSNDTRIVNAGIIWACDVNTPKMEGSVTGYEQTSISLGGKNGKVYTKTHNGTSSKLEDGVINALDYASSSQGAVPPIVDFAYTKYDEPEQSGSNDYSYYSANEQKFKISFDQGESKKWHYDILTVKKGNAILPYSVEVSDGAVVDSDNTITFRDAGDYIVTYEYEDSGNYEDDNGQVIKYSETYKEYVYVTVFVVEPETDPTIFTFGSNGYKTVSAGGQTYVMPNVTATKEPTKSSNVVTESGIGSKVIDGETIYYPIIGMHKVGSSLSYYNYFSIFEAVTIKDANGTDTYSISTTSVPSNLKVIGGFINNGAESANGTAIFNYSTGKTIKTKSVTVKGTNVGLCYYPDSSFSNSTSARDEQTIVVKYCYTDTNGKAYYYYIGYWCAQGKNGIESSNSGGSTGTCIAEGTLITMADGSKKAVEDLRKGNMVMAFDHTTGEIVTKEVLIVGKTYAESYYENTFVFDDGTILTTINEHGIFDLDLNQYVNIDFFDYQEYLGHRFVSVDATGKIGVKKLVNVETVVKSGYKYDIVTDQVMNYIAEDTLSVTHEVVDIVNSFAFGEPMMYDMEAMQADIEEYGLYTYEEFAAYCERSVFEQYNMAMMKVGEGKGMYTKEHIVYLLTEIALNEKVQIID